MVYTMVPTFIRYSSRAETSAVSATKLEEFFRILFKPRSIRAKPQIAEIELERLSNVPCLHTPHGRARREMEDEILMVAPFTL